MAVPLKPPVTLETWDWHDYRHLEPDVTDGDYLSSEAVLVCAGPPTLDMAGGQAAAQDTTLLSASAYPIGLAQSVSIGQNVQQMRIYEIGSNFDYIMSGRSVGSLTLARVIYSTNSLLRVLYAYYKTTGQIEVDPLFENPAAASATLNDVYINPGSPNMFMNMFSDLFKNPIGLMLVMRTTQNRDLAAMYLERCMVLGHSLALDPQGIIIQENAQLSFSRIVPVNAGTTSLLGTLTKDFNHFLLG